MFNSNKISYNNNGDKMKKNKTVTIIICTLLIIIAIISIIKIINYIKYRETYDYKLKQRGYTEEEIISIKKLNDKDINIILKKDYNEYIVPIIKEKYFIINNLNKYLEYIKNNKDKSLKDIVAIVNTRAHETWYNSPDKTDLSKDSLILTNKFNSLDNDYEPNDLIDISNIYSYGDNQKLRKVAYDAFVQMFNAAKENNITLIINSSYRSYKDQEDTYNKYISWYGEIETDKIASKPGFSEHQTGLAIDIQTYNTTKDNFENSDAFKWLKNNAYKYGFILRYPKDKEYLTGYKYEPWHYRYVGIDTAKYIQENDITFDEYYAYYIK